MDNARANPDTPAEAAPDEDSGLRFILSVLFFLTLVVVLTA